MHRVIPKGLLLAALMLGAALTAFAQDANKRNDRPQDSAGAPPRTEETKKAPEGTRYSYEFAQKDFIVNHIVITHDASGRGNISFERKGEETPIVEPVQLSTAAFLRIANLWGELRFLDSDESYQSSKNFAHLGTYKIGMDDGKRRRTAEFNWSDNKTAWSLANEYRKVSEQAILIFNLKLAREMQPLNAPSLLNEMESLLKRDGLSDPQQLIPLLNELRTDEHIPLIARNQAGRILKKIEK
jgi:hypothetical protein